jgi:hypothetical protein
VGDGAVDQERRRHGVHIEHVYADVGDDDIAIKSGMPNSAGPDAPSRDITITDCTFLHGMVFRSAEKSLEERRTSVPSASIFKAQTTASA